MAARPASTVRSVDGPATGHRPRDSASCPSGQFALSMDRLSPAYPPGELMKAGTVPGPTLQIARGDFSEPTSTCGASRNRKGIDLQDALRFLHGTRVQNARKVCVMCGAIERHGKKRQPKSRSRSAVSLGDLPHPRRSQQSRGLVQASPNSDFAFVSERIAYSTYRSFREGAPHALARQWTRSYLALHNSQEPPVPRCAIAESRTMCAALEQTPRLLDPQPSDRRDRIALCGPAGERWKKRR